MGIIVHIVLWIVFLFHNGYTAISTDITTNPLGTYCPVSSLNQSMVFSYPTDIYFQEEESVPNNIQSFHCYSFGKEFPSMHKCSHQTPCPITDHNLLKALELMTWHVNQNFCDFISRLEELKLNPDDSPISILFFGGSVTEGIDTWGCHCDMNINNNCPTIYQHHDKYKTYFYRANETKRWRDIHFLTECSWVKIIAPYLTNTYKSKIKVYNLARGGISSYLMSQELKMLLKQKDITFRKGDLVFLDYSVNDGLHISSPTAQKQIQQGVECLIRNLLTYSDIQPTIILLEMYPTRHEYSTIYHEVAKHYGIQLWSYKQAIQDTNLLPNQLKYANYLNFGNNLKIDHSRNHPPWHVHLFYADLIASLLNKHIQDNTIKRCAIKTPFTFTAAESITSATRTILPAPLYHIITHKCSKNHNDSILLDFGTPQLSLTRYDGVLDMLPAGSWSYREDRKNKYGIISEFRADESSGHTLRIVLDMREIREELSYVLHFKYMRTYRNAGIVEVFLCNNKIGSLDALWTNYETNFISVSDLTVFQIKHEVWRACKVMNSSVLELKHSLVPEKFSSSNKRPVRHRQKFKLETVGICIASSPVDEGAC